MKNKANMKKICFGLIVAVLASGAHASGNRDFADSRLADDRDVGDRDNRQGRDRSGSFNRANRADAKRVMLKDAMKMSDNEYRQVREVVLPLADAYTPGFYSWDDLGEWNLLQQRLKNVTVVLDCGDAKVIENGCLHRFPGTKLRVDGPQVKHIENNFLSDARGLLEIDVSSLTNVETIGDSFMAYCYDLERIDLTAFNNVIFIDFDCLNYTQSLQEVKIPEFSKLRYVGRKLLEGSAADRGIANKIREIATKNGHNGWGCVVSASFDGKFTEEDVRKNREFRAEQKARAAQEAQAENAGR
ncbi:MAG: hypothetical protein CNLJKLNK_00846 [Holosporales bacterium]